MEANQGSDALRRYPLHTTPYLRHSSSSLNQPLSSSSFVSPQSYSQRPTRTCSCPCSCMLSASLPQSNLQMSTSIKEATTSSTCKWGLDEDSNKENQSLGQASSPPKKWKYVKWRTTDIMTYLM